MGKDRIRQDQRTYYGFQTTSNGVDDMPATLIIHEPVKEPTLVEVGEALLARLDGESPFTYETTLAKSDFRAALAREKAKGEKTR